MWDTSNNAGMIDFVKGSCEERKKVMKKKQAILKHLGAT